MNSRLYSLAARVEDMAKNGYADRVTLAAVAVELRKSAARAEGAMTWLKRHATYEGDECLIFPLVARTVQGYAVVGVKRKPIGAHRVMCEMAHGPAPDPAMQAAHSCGVRDCVNPNHLRWATAKDNLADKLEHGTDNRGEKHYAAKLRNVDVLDIMPRLASGESPTLLANEYGVERGTIKNIASGRTWKHLTQGETA